MKFSERWLREWVNPAVDTETLGEQLTFLGLEVDEIVLRASLLPESKASNNILMQTA